MASPAASQPHHHHSYEDVDKLAAYINSRLSPPIKPSIGIILGSGLGSLVDVVEDKQCIPYGDIPGFPMSTAPGHAGQFVFGSLRGKSVVCMQGRFHLYEGYTPQTTVLPVRVMSVLGADTLIVTNAAGALNRTYRVGDMVVLKDHVFFPGLIGQNPLVGRNDEKFGVRFPSMTRAYDPDLRSLALEVGAMPEVNVSNFMKEGVYVQLGGPSYETIGECRMLQAMGIDLVGMSTCTEVIAAVHCGMRVFGMSLTTNICIVSYGEGPGGEPTSDEVLEAGKARSADIIRFMSVFVERIPPRVTSAN